MKHTHTYTHTPANSKARRSTVNLKHQKVMSYEIHTHTHSRAGEYEQLSHERTRGKKMSEDGYILMEAVRLRDGKHREMSSSP